MSPLTIIESREMMGGEGDRGAGEGGVRGTEVEGCVRGGRERTLDRATET